MHQQMGMRPSVLERIKTWLAPIIVSLIVLGALASASAPFTLQRQMEQQLAYAQGQDAFDREDYVTALAAFSRAGDYKDSQHMAALSQDLIGKQQDYREATAAFDREDYATAEVKYRSAGTYKDAQQRAIEAGKLRIQKEAYIAAQNAEAQKNYVVAKQQYLNAGSYKDAPKKAGEMQGKIDQESQRVDMKIVFGGLGLVLALVLGIVTKKKPDGQSILQTALSILGW